MRKKVLCFALVTLILLASISTAFASSPSESEWRTFPYLRRGRAGYPVRALQQVLLGSYVYCYMVLDSAGGADGSFGPKTEDAVMYFQKQQGLTQDGLVGKNTWGALSHYVYFTGTYEGGCPLYKVRSMPGSSLMYTVFRRVSSTHWQYRKPGSSSLYDIVNN